MTDKRKFTCECGFSIQLRDDQFPLHCWCGRTHYGFLDSSDSVIQCKAGSELSKLLKLIRIEPTPDCKCIKRAKTMDVRGCQWCRDNLDTIDGWLREEATRRGLPYSSFVGKRLVMLAIKRAEKAAQSS